ncbi:MAG: hypothetical protein ACOC26_05905, partial [Halochromatium sp.]
MNDSKNANSSLPAGAGLQGQGDVPAASASLGLSGRIARTFINTPVTPMLLIGALCIGLLGLL